MHGDPNVRAWIQRFSKYLTFLKLAFILAIGKKWKHQQEITVPSPPQNVHKQYFTDKMHIIFNYAIKVPVHFSY